MPYIPQNNRDALGTITDVLEENYPVNAGELNYVITKLIHSYYNRKQGGNYKAINDIAGALECAKLEFNRRIVVPYEDSKIEENGDL